MCYSDVILDRNIFSDTLSSIDRWKSTFKTKYVISIEIVSATANNVTEE